MASSAFQPTPRVLANRRNGSLGGIARAAVLSANQRRRIASKGGKATLKLYGTDFFSEIKKRS
jgi:hypothetical protein